MTSQESGVVRVPCCCAANRRHGFVRVVAFIDGDTGEREDPSDPKREYYGDAWETTLLDAQGQTHTLETKRCPLCGAYLVGLEYQELPRKESR